MNFHSCVEMRRIKLVTWQCGFQDELRVDPAHWAHYDHALQCQQQRSTAFGSATCLRLARSQSVFWAGPRVTSVARSVLCLLLSSLPCPEIRLSVNENRDSSQIQPVAFYCVCCDRFPIRNVWFYIFNWSSNLRKCVTVSFHFISVVCAQGQALEVFCDKFVVESPGIPPFGSSLVHPTTVWIMDFALHWSWPLTRVNTVWIYFRLNRVIKVFIVDNLRSNSLLLQQLHSCFRNKMALARYVSI